MVKADKVYTNSPILRSILEEFLETVPGNKTKVFLIPVTFPGWVDKRLKSKDSEICLDEFHIWMSQRKHKEANQSLVKT